MSVPTAEHLPIKLHEEDDYPVVGLCRWEQKVTRSFSTQHCISARVMPSLGHDTGPDFHLVVLLKTWQTEQELGFVTSSEL